MTRGGSTTKEEDEARSTEREKTGDEFLAAVAGLNLPMTSRNDGKK